MFRGKKQADDLDIGVNSFYLINFKMEEDTVGHLDPLRYENTLRYLGPRSFIPCGPNVLEARFSLRSSFPRDTCLPCGTRIPLRALQNPYSIVGHVCREKQRCSLQL